LQERMSDLKKVTIYTDGACTGNPGPGGYGVVLLHGGLRKELSGGFRRTTNNRMELMAAITGLRALKTKCEVKLHTDSQYVAESLSKGWAKSWRERGWKKSDKSKALNADLWQQLLDLCDQHEVKVIWVRGHAGNVENERCDQLSVAAAQQPILPPDHVYERGSSPSSGI